MLSLFASVDSLQAALDYHLERHNILSSNIAHVDTPGYVPRDLERVDPTSFANTLNVAIAKTHPGHLGLSGNVAVTTGRVFEDATGGAGKDLNAVSLDREAGKLAANQIRYDVLSSMITGKLSTLAWVANDARG